jgi:putative glycosyltransferase (TIGR04372 family)
LIDTETTGLDFYGVYARTSPTLQLLEAEVAEAARLAQKLGLPQGARWVCLAARDSSYLAKERPSVDWSYHNYRDSQIANYVLAAETLANLGYYVIRMGREVHGELPSSNEKIIDYAVSENRCDLLDVYLGFGCTFFLSPGSGVDDFAGAARKPRCFVNFMPFGSIRTEEPKSILITKSQIDAVTNKVLTQSELIERGAHNFFASQQYEESQICLQENSPEEIRDVALEMQSLVGGKYEQSPADKMAQQRFWQIYPLEGLRAPGVPVRTLIGKQFLQDNPQWLH